MVCACKGLSLMSENVVSYEIGEYQLDVLNRKLLHQTTEIDLSERSYLLLLTLAQTSPEIVTKQILMSKLWPDRVVSDWALSRLLSDTRALMPDVNQHHVLIKTARGIGYALTQVTPIYAGDKTTVKSDLQKPATSNRAFKLGTFLLAICVLGVLSFFGFWYVQKPTENPLFADKQIHSIAVLPLESFSKKTELMYFADGLAEELIHQLTMLPDLNVVSRNATFAFKNRNIDPREIAKQLNVTHIIEGSVRQSDESVRITLQLIRAADGYHQWSKVFDSKHTAILEVQEEIGQSIASLISPNYDRNKFNIMRNHPKSNAAYAHFLKAAVLMGKDQPKLLTNAKSELEQALKLAPDYALAHAAMAKAILLQHQFSKEPLTIAGPEARQHIQAALKTEPSSAEAFSALGLYHSYHSDFIEAENAYRTALSLNPALVSAQHNLGFSYWMQNQFVLARQHFESALALNPLAPMSNFALADTLYSEGFVDQAFSQYEHCLAVIIDFPACLLGLSGLQLITGNEQQAKILLEKSANILGENNPYVLGSRGRVALWSNDLNIAEQILQPLIEVDGNYINLRHMTLVQLGLGKITSWQRTVELLLVQTPNSNTLRLITALSAYYNHDCDRALQLYEQVMAENASKHSSLDDFSMGVSHISNMLTCYKEQRNKTAITETKALFAAHLSQLDKSANAVLGVAFIQQKFALLNDTNMPNQQTVNGSLVINWPLSWLEKKR